MPDTASTQAAAQGLAPISRPDGTLAIVAMDQRNTLRRMLSAENRPTDPEAIRSFKVDVVEALSPAANAVLLDPSFGVPAVRAANAMAPGCATVVAVEPEERNS
jgi:tagatose-1,6-bisphosphate aldolase